MGDLVWVRNFLPKPLEKEFFPRHITVKDFFSSILQQEIFLFKFFYPLEISL